MKTKTLEIPKKYRAVESFESNWDDDGVADAMKRIQQESKSSLIKVILQKRNQTVPKSLIILYEVNLLFEVTILLIFNVLIETKAKRWVFGLV